MKTEARTDARDQKPTPVDLDARYRRIGIPAVAAAMRYCGDPKPADPSRDRDEPTRHAP